MSMFFPANWMFRSAPPFALVQRFGHGGSAGNLRAKTLRVLSRSFLAADRGGAAAPLAAHGGIALRVPPGRPRRPVGGPAGRDTQSGRVTLGTEKRNRRTGAEQFHPARTKNSQTESLANVQADKCKQRPQQKPSAVQTKHSADQRKRNPESQKKKSAAKT